MDQPTSWFVLQSSMCQMLTVNKDSGCVIQPLQTCF